MNTKYLLTLTFILLCGSAFAQTNVPALITSSQTWTTAGNPYLVKQNCYLDSGVTLTVNPGVKIVATDKMLSMKVDGTLRLEGSSSAPIDITDLQFDYQKNSPDYDPGTGKGSVVQHCFFRSNYLSSNRALNTRTTDLHIMSSTFRHYMYSISALGGSTDSLNLYIDSCLFIDSASRTYPINISGTGTTTTLTNSRILGGSGVNLSGMSILKNNYVHGVKYYFNLFGECVVDCNTFVSVRDGIEIRTRNIPTDPTIQFTSNTLDSCGLYEYSPMVMFRNVVQNLNTSKIKFENNNFLYTPNKTKEKIVIQGSNPNPTSYKTLDFRANYWGTTDTLLIDSFIKDYKDDINIFGWVKTDSFRTRKIKTCDRSSCDASYYLAVDTANKYNLYIINNSRGITKNTKYIWTFGDGKGSTKENPVHQYSSFGLYELCLTIYDSAAKCYSTYCDSIGLDSNGKLLKEDGFTIRVLNEDDLISVPKVELLEGFKVSPNPSSGTIKLSGYLEGFDQIEYELYDLQGRLILDGESEPMSGEFSMPLQLKDANAGLHILRVKTSLGQKTFRLIIQP